MSQASKQSDRLAKELTVCDIIGDWGAYQWSLTLFGVIYSALLSITVDVGPIWTPDMKFACADQVNSSAKVNFTESYYECPSKNETSSNETSIKCEHFIYDDSSYGKLITNSFDLVCDRHWLKSFLSSSALVGMLLSSVTLGLVSDKFGRLRCIQVAFLISILATISAILAHNYFLLNICFLFMSYAQVGAGNAICTLVMEATSPKWRFVPVFEYGIGWGLGTFLTPFINDLTKNYVHFLFIMLAWQILLIPWLYLGVHESIRWLLSEGQIVRAQIELRKACRMNRIENGARLAHDIARIQAQQVRRASRMIADELAPERLAKALEQQVSTTSQELDMLSAAIKNSFGFTDADGPRLSISEPEKSRKVQLQATPLSPALARVSFSVPLDRPEFNKNSDSMIEYDEAPRNSLTSQAIMKLAMKYSKTLEKQEQGQCFLIQIFHSKLYKITILLMLLSVLTETTYYGFIQANKFVGTDVNLNYKIGALSEWLANFLFMLLLWLFSRRLALITPTLMIALVCIGMAANYHLLPNDSKPPTNSLNLSNLRYETIDQLDSIILNDTITASIDYQNQTQIDKTRLYELREEINFWLMNAGKMADGIAIQCIATIAMESYPNNLRQSGSGAIVLVGRMGSILAPFLFNDTSPDRIIFKSTLLIMAIIGILSSCLVPFSIKENKNKELSDHLDEI